LQADDFPENEPKKSSDNTFLPGIIKQVPELSL